MDFVDDYLAAARALMGTGHSPTPTTPTPTSPSPATPTTWAGAASVLAGHHTTTLDTHRGQLHTVNTHTHRIITAADDIPTLGHRTLNAIQSGWESDKAALAPWSNTAAGKSALLRAGQQRIAETQLLIGDVATRYGAAAAAIRTTQLGLPTAPALDDDIDPDTGVPRRGDPRPPRISDELTSTPGPRRPAPAPLASTPVASAPRPFTAPPVATSIPLTSLVTPLASSLPAATALPSLASAAPSALTPMLQPLTQLGSSSQTVLANSLSPTTDNLPFARTDDPRSSIREKVVAEARRALGLPYVWGGGGARGPSGGGFDCSGLTQFAVAQATGGQVILPRTTYGQIYCGRAVDLAHARPGDLVFSNFSHRGPEHVQIFAGRTDAGVPMVIEAQQRGVPVKFSALSGPAVFRRVI